jgi:hypothetical protein
MDLPADVLYLILNKLTLKDISNVCSSCTFHNSVIKSFDWDTYLKYRNPLTKNLTNVNKFFMIGQGRYILKISDEKIITSWNKLQFFISLLDNIINKNIYNSDIIKDFFLSNSNDYLYFCLYGTDDKYIKFEIDVNKNVKVGDIKNVGVEDIKNNNSSNLQITKDYIVDIVEYIKILISNEYFYICCLYKDYYKNIYEVDTSK